ncbi:ribosomal L7Ae/L30e/S12e/Gadd45 family protein [Clostridium sp. MSJ-4]|uniref:Ribosomal L7Ae/L30e/S12e/Gadd45 family protein n=1 Tax=Clostridium simiarum TaxID=2841506 RepID=A0ABS6EZ18_9CLOT|nr:MULTISPECIES: ribosomal L7Ae/L30e/S12e/Gadd45 family protein [Clostridium]MBU5590648.1 ribosomal L7Ae/L30e/S12e/Gadd45 family protein [Clostridium simiarum]
MTNKFFQFLGIVKKSGNLIEGYNRCEDAIKRNKKIYLMILSEDLSPKSKKEFLRYCNDKNIPYIENYSKYDLGSSLGRAEINILAVIDKNMSDKLIECNVN